MNGLAYCSPRRRLVVVVGEDPLVGEAIMRQLGNAGVRAIHLEDFEVAFTACATMNPAVVVLDQIVDSPEIKTLLARLEGLKNGQHVVLLRYAAGPACAFSTLRVHVVAGECWFEELPQVVMRHTLG